MELYMKIGTMPGKIYHVMYKHNLPKVGNIIFIRPPEERRARQESVIITEIRDVSGGILFMATRS